jgi:hypothetical protein
MPLRRMTSTGLAPLRRGNSGVFRYQVCHFLLPSLIAPRQNRWDLCSATIVRRATTIAILSLRQAQPPEKAGLASASTD